MKGEARKESLHGHSTWTSDPLSGRLVLGKDGMQVEIQNLGINVIVFEPISVAYFLEIPLPSAVL